MRNDGERFSSARKSSLPLCYLIEFEIFRSRAARPDVRRKKANSARIPPTFSEDVTEELNNSDVLHAHSATGGNFGFSVVEDAANITPIRADATNELVL